MAETDLHAAWVILETRASSTDTGIEVVGSGIRVQAGEVLFGVDHSAHRHVLIPLQPGEAFAEDRRGRSVHLLKIKHSGSTYLSATCVDNDLHSVFAQFAAELMTDLSGTVSPAKTTVAALDRWRRLFSDAGASGLLSEPQLIGLLAELLVLERLVTLDAERRLGSWTGPTGSQHDFRRGSHAIEVKATLAREGRVVSISSLDQMNPPAGGTLHLAHHRFEPDPAGDSVPAAIERILNLGVAPKDLLLKLNEVGYQATDAGHYSQRAYRLVDRRIYDVEAFAFPRLVPGSFTTGGAPPGILRVSYSIDLTNEPPVPVPDDAVDGVLGLVATA